MSTPTKGLRKDLALTRLAEKGNVAQFAAFDAAGKSTVNRIRGVKFDAPIEIRDAAKTLIERSSEGRINIRSFHPDDHQSKPFDYGLTDIDRIAAIVAERNAAGLWVILNETIDIHDGGVSGVVEGGRMEVTPDDLPRGVEKGGCAAWSARHLKLLLSRIYDTSDIPEAGNGERIEFSVHPHLVGVRQTRVLLWETAPSSLAAAYAAPHGVWPNKLSRMIGDKLYGLLVADILGLRVPFTTAHIRRMSLTCVFGAWTGNKDHWTRTSPREQKLDAGKSRTILNSSVPATDVLHEQEPEGRIAPCPDTGAPVKTFDFPSVLLQMAVNSVFSGKSIEGPNGEIIAEGVAGRGDGYMAGTQTGTTPDASVMRDLEAIHLALRPTLGAVEIEFVYDGQQIWIVQLQPGKARGVGNVLVPGDAGEWLKIAAGASLEEFRSLAQRAVPGQGIEVDGRIGLTSHKADLLRRAGLPARMSVPQAA